GGGVAVGGGGGEGGGGRLGLRAGHPGLELGPVTAESSAGRPIAELHPHLAGVPSLAGRTFDAAGALTGSGCDLTFLALPAGQSARQAADLGQDTRLVDLGPDFRLADAASWGRHSHGPHAAPCAPRPPHPPRP